MTEQRKGSPPEQRTLAPVTFEIVRFVDVPDTVVQAAKKGTAMVWQRYFSEPTSMHLDFVHNITDPYGYELPYAAMYYPPTLFTQEKTEFARKYLHNSPLQLTEAQATLFYGAHEATHKVQIARGDPPTPLRLLSGDEYAYDRHEMEAWDEAAHVMRNVYPDLDWRFTVAGVDYTLPDVSKY